MVSIKDINFRQPKYIIPALVYLPLLFIGYMVLSVLSFEKEEETDKDLEVTEDINIHMATPNIDGEIGDKRSNMDRSYGRIFDETGVENIESDRDSLHVKEEYQSKYDEYERRLLEQEQRHKEELAALQNQNRPTAPSRRSSAFDTDDLPGISEEERASLERFRRRNQLSSSRAILFDEESSEDSVAAPVQAVRDTMPSRAVQALGDDAREMAVVKKGDDGSSYFQTISANESQNNLITAIIDENVSVVDGSRVRLRLLDAVEIGSITLPRGTYLYATMSGFSKQRVRGKVESVMYADELYKVNLSIYDLDGLEGLYVPSSSFREAAKDAAGSMSQGGSIGTSISTDGTDLARMGAQALQRGYQQVTSAVSKAIKKNRVKLKYGSQIYLINAQSNRRSAAP